jgi:hypothetical protein
VIDNFGAKASDRLQEVPGEHIALITLQGVVSRVPTSLTTCLGFSSSEAAAPALDMFGARREYRAAPRP